eukprot:359744_1
MLMKKILIILSILAIISNRKVEAGPLSCAAGVAFYGSCQTACNAAWCACMTASGLTAGATGPVGWYAWLTSAAAACSALQGTCMAACAASAAAMCAAPAP